MMTSARRLFLLALGVFLNFAMVVCGFVALIFLYQTIIPEPSGDHEAYGQWMDTALVRGVLQGLPSLLSCSAAIYWPWWNHKLRPAGSRRDGASDEPSADEFQEIWPIIRVCKDFWGRKVVVRIESDWISFLSTRAPVTEDLLACDKRDVDKIPFIHCRRDEIRAIYLDANGVSSQPLLGAWFSRFGRIMENTYSASLTAMFLT